MLNFYRKCLLVVFVFLPLGVLAQNDVQIKGRVTGDGEPVVGAHITLKPLDRIAVTNRKGNFEFKDIVAAKDSVYLIVSAVGFQKHTQEYHITEGKAIDASIELETKVHGYEDVVVTGSLYEMAIKQSPVKVNVIGQEFIDKNPSNNLMNSVEYINGLDNQVSCGVCGTNSIRINGMEGPYTSMLIDGMPIMGSLASVYGLNGINPAVIKKMEIIKGPNSTLYGSEAMGGVVNIITKDPEDLSHLKVHTYGTTHREGNLDISTSGEFGNFETFLSGNIYHFDHFMDHNNDGFADAPLSTKMALFNKWRYHFGEDQSAELALKYYSEDRMGGVQEFSHQLRGSSEIYGESIYTERFEALSQISPTLWEEELNLKVSYSYHDQDSYYGDYHYRATQHNIYADVVWHEDWNKRLSSILGAALEIDELNQTFPNSTGSTTEYRDQQISNRVPGVFSQVEYRFSADFKALAGLRMDHQKHHGMIASPRLNTKWDLSDHTTLRTNLGTGFRIVNLFTEEHDVIMGNREVVITEELNPERSYNGTLNLNQIVDIGSSVMNIDMDLFYTHFLNQIVPDYSNPNEIRYSNLEQYSVSRGASLSMSHNFPGPLLYSVGITLQDVFRRKGEQNQRLEYAPEFKSVFSAKYTIKKFDLTVDYTGHVTGPMKLPEYEDKPTYSEWFTRQNIKFTKDISSRISAYLSVKNLFNYTQDDPIIAPDRPFSEDFATDRVYGPVETRKFMAGISFSMH